MLLLKRLRTTLMPHTRLWLPFCIGPVVLQFEAAAAETNRRAAGALNDTPLFAMEISMWLPIGVSSTPRSAVVSGKSVRILAIWCAPVNCVWTTVFAFMIHVWPSVALRESRNPPYRAA